MAGTVSRMAATSIVNDIDHRKTSLSGEYRCTLEDLVSRDLCMQFKCVLEDEITVQDSLCVNPIPALACTFNPDGIHGNLLLADEEGVARLINTQKPLQDSLIKEWSAHHDAIFDAQWLSESNLVLGSGDGTCSLWDTCKGIKTGVLRGHQASVKSVDVNRDCPDVLVSGGRDGRVLVWDTRCFAKGNNYKPIHVIEHAHSKSKIVTKSATRRKRPTETVTIDTTNGVTSSLFYKDNFIATAGAADGTVKLWDKRRLSSSCSNPPSLFTFKPPESSHRVHGFASLITDPSHAYLYAGCMDNIIYVFNGTTLKTQYPVGGFSGHVTSSFYVKTSLSPCGRFLLSGSSCGDAFIWDVKDPQTPPILLTGHTKEVTAVAWAPNQIDKIVTCSDDCDVRIWRHNQLSSPYVVGKCAEYRGTGHKKFSTIPSCSRPVLQSVENITKTTPTRNTTDDSDNKISWPRQTGVTTPSRTPKGNTPSRTKVTPKGSTPSRSPSTPVSTPRGTKRKSTNSRLTPRTSKRQLNTDTMMCTPPAGRLDRYLVKMDCVK